MTLRWPWQRNARHRQDRLVFASTPEGLAWLHAEPAGERLRVIAHGQLAREGVADADWQRAVKQLALPAAPAIAVLPLPAYQLLQIEAPVVPADELRAAARWRVKDMVDGHIDEVTLDVLRLGLPGSQVQGNEQMFVVAAPNREVAAVTALATGAGWRLAVVDVADIAQRNLQHAAATAMDLGERATACLAVHDQVCLLTICAGGELFYSRRLEWDAALIERARRAANPPPPPPPPPPAPPAAPAPRAAHAPRIYTLDDVSLGDALATEAPEADPYASISLDAPAVEFGAPAPAQAYGQEYGQSYGQEYGQSYGEAFQGSSPAATELTPDDTPRLVVELQRSFDVWERSWPDRPLSLLMLHLPETAPDKTQDTTPATAIAASFLQTQLGLRVLPLALDAALELPAGSAPPALPLLGALLRDRALEA